MNPNEQVPVPDNNEDDEALRQALAIQVPPEKLKRLAHTHPPPPSWFLEEFNRPPSTDALD